MGKKPVNSKTGLWLDTDPHKHDFGDCFSFLLLDSKADVVKRHVKMGPRIVFTFSGKFKVLIKTSTVPDMW